MALPLSLENPRISRKKSQPSKTPDKDLMVSPRITRKFLIAIKMQKMLENYGLYNAMLALALLGTLCVDTYVAWKENLFLATSEDDQYSTLIFFFGTIGYFMASAVLGDILYDRPPSRPLWGVFDGLVVSLVHILLLVCYLFYWITLPADIWNPCHYYMPDFYWVTYHLFPLFLVCHALLNLSVAFVIHRKRSTQHQVNVKWQV